MPTPSPAVPARTVALALLIPLAACSEGAGPPPPVTGDYTLTTLGGRALPATYGCGVSVSSGQLVVTADSVTLRWVTGSGSTAESRERHGSRAAGSDETQLVVSFAAIDYRDTVTVARGGATDRAWLPVPPACSGTGVVQVDLGFAHD